MKKKSAVMMLVMCALTLALFGCSGKEQKADDQADRNTGIVVTGAQEVYAKTPDNSGKKSDVAASEVYFDGSDVAVTTMLSESPEWVVKLPQAEDAKQLFIVGNYEGTTAWVSMHEKDENGTWQMIMTTPGYIGKAGLGKTKEGDAMTPVGTYKFNAAFGIAPDPGCAIAYIQADDDTYWSGDGRDGMHYNEMVSIKDCPGLNTEDSERIVDYTRQYQYCLNIDYNKECVPGEGSAIFLHCLGPNKPYTGGCVAIPENQMKFVMQHVDPECVVVIDTLENLGAGFGAAPAAAETVSDDGIKLSDDSSDFVLLSEAVPDVILEIRYYSTYNFTGERVDGYEEPVALLTKEAADALKKASDELVEMGYRFKIYDAYRPQEAVTDFVNWAKDPDDTRMKEYFYPELSKDVLFPRGYIAKHSGHSRGSTLDLTLFDMETGKEVDMGGTFDYFGELSHPDYRGITDEQYENRMLLRNIMVKHGFDPYNEEWWHFKLHNEPYPDTYFTFPVRSDSVR
ncbi:MAG: L,D-transpeptidase family protein [Lachnospiraceae bacterium]|nr:L,D-transpeptidase family protein [Lachnospiraceae bacterium]